MLRDPTGQQRASSVDRRRRAVRASRFFQISAAAAGGGDPPRRTLPLAPHPAASRSLGGLILNLMPCVFPVLAIKAVGLGRAVGRRAPPRARGLSAGFYVPPACCSPSPCLAVAAPRACAAAGSSAAGWGFQFQSLAFVAGTCWLLFLVGLNLVGGVRAGPAPGRDRAGLGQPQRPCRRLRHRPAGGAGGDAVHRAVHGRGDRRRAGGSRRGRDGGVPGDGAGGWRCLIWCSRACRGW